MAVERLMLEIPAKIAEMMKNGTAYRDGGIVREVDTKRIVGFLKDTDASQSELVNANVVPLAMMGVSMMAINHRLNKIEASIRSLKKDIEGLATEVGFTNIQMYGQMIGRLMANLQACHFEIQEDKTDRLLHYRAEFLKSHHEFKLILQNALENPKYLREKVRVLRSYYQAMVLAGIASRDVSYRIGGAQSAEEIARQLSQESTQIEELIQRKLSAPSALFWRQAEHVDLALDIRESAARLRSHDEMLRQLPANEIELIAQDQLK